jgi:hypothetical protein
MKMRQCGKWLPHLEVQQAALRAARSNATAAYKYT